MNKPTTQPALIKDLKMDATISFDDVINVFVSRFETELFAQRASIQANLKANQAEKKDLQKQIGANLDEQLEAIFAPLVDGFHDVVVSFYWNKGLEATPNNKERVKISITQTTTLPEGMQAPDYQGKLPTISKDFDIQIAPPAELISAWKANDVVGEDLKQKLLAVNAEMQGIDRKTRQIKGLIAERKLQDAGMQDLLANEEISKILQLPAA